MARFYIKDADELQQAAVEPTEIRQQQQKQQTFTPEREILDNPLARFLAKAAYKTGEGLATLGGLPDLVKLFSPQGGEDPQETIDQMPNLPPQIRQYLEQAKPRQSIFEMLNRENVKQQAAKVLPERLVYEQPDDSVLEFLTSLAPNALASLATAGGNIPAALANLVGRTALGEGLGQGADFLGNLAGLSDINKQRVGTAARIAGNIAYDPLKTALTRSPRQQAVQRANQTVDKLTKEEAMLKPQASAKAREVQAKREQTITKAKEKVNNAFEQFRELSSEANVPLDAQEFIADLDKIQGQTAGLSLESEQRVNYIIDNLRKKAELGLTPDDIATARRNLNSEITFGFNKQGAGGDSLLKQVNAAADKQIDRFGTKSPEVIKAYREANKAQQDFIAAQSREAKAADRQLITQAKEQASQQSKLFKRDIDKAKSVVSKLEGKKTASSGSAVNGLIWYSVLKDFLGGKIALGLKGAKELVGQGLDTFKTLKYINELYPDIIDAYKNDIVQAVVQGGKQSVGNLNRITQNIKTDYLRRQEQQKPQQKSKGSLNFRIVG